MKLVLTALESEKSQAKPGWQDRVNALQKTRDEAVEINRLGKPGSIRGKNKERTRRLVSSFRSKLKRLKKELRVKHGKKQSR